MTAFVTVAALLADAALGEPPARIHPAVLMGKTISLLEKPALKHGDPATRRAAGVLIAVALPGAFYLISASLLARAPRNVRALLEISLLSTTISFRGLATVALAVEADLKRNDLAAARARVGTFVGRDTDGLSETEVARAAIESVAENLSDGVTAPMFYGSLFGAPGALAYKAVNTLDSMIGYKHPPYTDLGHASARLDDLANFLPARLTALATAAVSTDVSATLSTVRRFAHLTPSPNAGWPEAAFAGALGLRLGGVNFYGGARHAGPTLGTGRPPRYRDIGNAVALMRGTCAALAGLALFLAGTRRA